MRNLRTIGTGATILSLLLTLDAAAQVERPGIGQVPKRIAVNPPRLTAIVTAAPELTVAPELVVADLSGNGIDLSGAVRTSLATGSPVGIRWVKPQSDDALIVVDATALRTSGFSLTTAAGQALDGLVLPRGGVRVTDASGSSFTVSNGAELLARLDGNGDGRLDESDRTWSATMLFRDRNADGAMGPGEIGPAGEALRSISLAPSGTESADALGTRSVPGVAHLRNGAAITIAHARPATIE